MKQMTDAELRAEIARRERAAREREAAARKAAEIRVYCPRCDGAGVVPNGDTIRVGTREDDPYVKCNLCEGSRTIVARMV